MIYIISEKIIFNTHDGTLTVDGINDSVKLTLPAARLLEVLLNNHGKIIERNYLLTEVWDKHGLVGSDSNLNQYISVLRRTLSTLGIDDFVQTIPKVGFKLNNDITVKYDRIITTPEKKTLRLRGVYVAFFSVFIIFMIVFYAYLKKQRTEIDLKKVFFRGCAITYLEPISDRETEKLNLIIMNILSKKEVICDSDDVVYFDSYNSYDSNKLGRIMVSVCNNGVDNENTKCKTFFFNDRK